jgi:hypothetical protein
MPKSLPTTLIISVKEARKLLGQQNKDLTDDQLEKLIVDLSAIAKLYIRSVPKY